jgi:hypothetical protein
VAAARAAAAARAVAAAAWAARAARARQRGRSKLASHHREGGEAFSEGAANALLACSKRGAASAAQQARRSKRGAASAAQGRWQARQQSSSLCAVANAAAWALVHACHGAGGSEGTRLLLAG